MNDRPLIAVSACLLGANVRYDGGNKSCPAIHRLLETGFTALPLCPEEECGMGTPRPPIRRIVGDDPPRLVRIEDGHDVSRLMADYAEGRVRELARAGIRGAVLKARSPSCGVGNTPVFDDGDVVDPEGSGAFSLALRRAFPTMPVATEDELASDEAIAEFAAKVREHAR